MVTEHRRGYEFSEFTRQMALKRAKGKCEALDLVAGRIQRCLSPHDGTVDHIFGIKLSQVLGADRFWIRSLANAQCLCDVHQQVKLARENRQLGMIEEVQRSQIQQHMRRRYTTVPGNTPPTIADRLTFQRYR